MLLVIRWMLFCLDLLDAGYVSNLSHTFMMSQTLFLHLAIINNSVPKRLGRRKEDVEQVLPRCSLLGVPGFGPALSLMELLVTCS